MFNLTSDRSQLRTSTNATPTRYADHLRSGPRRSPTFLPGPGWSPVLHDPRTAFLAVHDLVEDTERCYPMASALITFNHILAARSGPVSAREVAEIEQTDRIDASLNLFRLAMVGLLTSAGSAARTA